MDKLDELKSVEKELISEIRSLNREKRKLIVRLKDRITHLKKLNIEQDREIKKFLKNNDLELKKAYKEAYREEIANAKAKVLVKVKEYQKNEMVKIKAKIEEDKISLKAEMRAEILEYKKHKKKQLIQKLNSNLMKLKMSKLKEINTKVKNKEKEKLKKIEYLDDLLSEKEEEVREKANTKVKFSHTDKKIPIYIQYPYDNRNLKQVLIVVPTDLHTDYKKFCKVNNFVMGERIREYMVHDINKWKILINKMIQDKKDEYEEKKLQRKLKKENKENDDLDS